MTRDEAVLSIAKYLCSYYGNCKGCGSEGICDVGISAQVMYDRGYSKQSEGEWKIKWKSTLPQYEPSEYECSVCGYRRTVLHKFCPNCGAKMKGV